MSMDTGCSMAAVMGPSAPMSESFIFTKPEVVVTAMVLKPLKASVPGTKYVKLA